MISALRSAASGMWSGQTPTAWSWPRFGWLEWGFLLIALVAAGMRLWELDGRVMHYDEAIHLHYAWKLARGVEFLHSPWMHGPLQIEMVAVFLRVLGDTDFVARLPYALFGVALVILPYFLRRQIGDKGAICAAIIMAFSPSLLYFSRFGRNDILMVVWATLLLIFLWRYAESSKSRYLFGTAAVTALMLASKETAYFVILFMGLAALGLGWRQLWDVARRRMALADARRAAGFFVLMATLTLPQAAAGISVLQGPLGLTLAAGDTGSTGETGAPVWEAPFVSLPLWDAPVWMHVIGLLALLGAALGLAWFVWRVRNALDLAAVAVATTCAVAAVSVMVVGPVQGLLHEQRATGMYLDCAIGAALLVMGTAMGLVAPSALRGSRRVAALLGPSAILTWLWLAAFGSGLTLAAELLPAAAPVADLEAGRVAVNYLVPVLTLLLLLAVGGAVGIAWGGGVWILCAGLFYAIWATLYTTFFTNWPGVFTGAWQSLGYWLAQQEVARGNQPWYYYGVGLTVYELLALPFGLAAVVWLIRRRGPFDIVLAAWVIATLVIYTVAAEKMPWLLVNITVPLALAAGMLLGHVMDGLRWPLLAEARWRLGILVALAPVWAATAVWVAWLAARGDAANLPVWLAGLILLPMAGVMAWLVRMQPGGGRAVALGFAGLLLVFGTVAAFRAAYTYDDSKLEILAYAQGSADLVDSYADLRAGALTVERDATVKVDYDMWYPFQWYVRGETEEGVLWFDRFCAANVKSGSDECRKVGEDTGPEAYLAEVAHAVAVEDAEAYRREGPMRNLLWYPETYRRPGEARDETGMWSQLAADVDFFRDSAANPEKWQQAIEYIVARRQESDWYSAEYYQYVKDQGLQ
ncbi:MAG: TIGR03663 family protein [Chloroflexi bacterium]|nr:TIGR03663 family protein [Chloroflexota bacterium]